jgi:hypothetical protein
MSFLAVSTGAEPPPATGVSWGEIYGKPQAFPPQSHKSNHATGGSDPLWPEEIGAVANGGGVKAIRHLTQEEYDAATRDQNTLYIIT